MTIPAPLLEALQKSGDPLPRALEDSKCDTAIAGRELGPGNGELMDEKTFRYLLNLDGCGTDKLGEGLRSFIELTEQVRVEMRVGDELAGSLSNSLGSSQLEEVIEKKVEEALVESALN